MTARDADSMAEKPETHSEGSGRKSREYERGASSVTTRREDSGPEAEQLMEAVVERENMVAALQRVVSNRGAAGVDGMTVEQLKPYLKEEWKRIKEELVGDEYRPKPVLKVEIPKADGKGMRKLGIPTVVDRLIQQAMHQVLSTIFEPNFSESSYGFRPSRSAHDAVRQARAYVSEGRRWVVDIDLEKFFDRVNHDVLMSRVARWVKDKRILRLIRRYLQAGMMEGGIVSQRREGTPQGGPLSPLLSNLLLDELDKELEQRGHRFVRYADDCNIYVRSERAGERVMAGTKRFLERRLRLKVNEQKSAVGKPSERKFLGYSFTSEAAPRRKIAKQSVQRFKERVRELTKRGRNLQLVVTDLTRYLRGWAGYYGWCETKTQLRELDGWTRRRL